MDNLQQEPTAQDLKFSERRKWTLKEWWEHVGAWKTDRDTLEFGSTIAFGVMMQQFAACLKWTLTQQPVFPVRDLSKSAEQQGIFQKFDVRRTDGSSEPGGKHYGCKYFVLDLDHDPYSPAAMQAYAEKCNATHPVLSAEIKAKFGKPCTTCGGAVSVHSPDGEYRGECPFCAPKENNNAAVAAIEFALKDDSPMEFLRCWNEGNFDAIRKEWPDAPESVFIGADPLHPLASKGGK